MTNQNSGILRENPLSPDEIAQNETDEMLDIKYEDPSELIQEKDSAREALGGIGELSPEESQLRAREAREAELKDEEPEMTQNLQEVGEVGVSSGTETTSQVGQTGVINTRSELLEQDEGATEQSESIDEQLSLDEHPDAPLINRLVGDQVITGEQGEEIKQRVQNGENFDEVVSNDPTISDDIANLIIERHQEINNSDENMAEDNISSFKNDFSSELQDSGIDGISEERQENIVSQIGRVYITGENVERKSADFEMAIDTAINTEFNTVSKSFHRTLEFEVLFEDVKNPTLSFQERIIAYSDVVDMLQTDIGAKGGKKNRENEAAQRRLQLNKSGLQEKFEQAIGNLQLAKKENNTQEVLVIQKEIESLKQQSRDILNTSIGNFDTALEIGGEEVQTTLGDTRA